MKSKSLFDEYTIKEKLGEGAYGCVYKVQHKFTNFLRAVKAIKRKHVDSTDFSNEIAILKTVDHPNIIKLFDCYYDNNYYYMVEEFCSGGDLYDYIKKQKYFTEKTAAHILYQLLNSVNYLHKKNIVHRDLKPENIVFVKTGNKKNYNVKNDYEDNYNDKIYTSENTTKQNETSPNKHDEIFIKLIDFGTSVHLTKNVNLTQELGTIYYIAPEVFKNNYNEKADVWSCGIILYIMLCGHPPFCGKKEEEIKKKILYSPLNFPKKEFENISPSAISFVEELLTYDFKKRISAEKALKNEWLNKMLKISDEEINYNQSNIINNLSKFTSVLTLQKATLSFITNQISINDEIKRLKNEFDKIDSNHDGMISKEELIHCLELIHPHEEAVKKAYDIFHEIDFNNDGSINFSEFITVNMEKEKVLNEKMLKNAFKIFDLDGNGYITIDELKETIPLEIQNNSQWIDIVKEVDQDGDCQINYEEFKFMMEKICEL